MQSLFTGKAGRSAIAAVAIFAAIAWIGAEDMIARRDTWNGTIVEVDKRRKWWKGHIKPLDRKTYLYYNHYWEIREADGKVRMVKVPHTAWQKGEPGKKVVKIKGERWPKIHE